jgi:hypothetical protein
MYLSKPMAPSLVMISEREFLRIQILQRESEAEIRWRTRLYSRISGLTPGCATGAIAEQDDFTGSTGLVEVGKTSDKCSRTTTRIGSAQRNTARIS